MPNVVTPSEARSSQFQPLETTHVRLRSPALRVPAAEAPQTDAPCVAREDTFALAQPTPVRHLRPLAPADLMWCRLPGPSPMPTGVLRFDERVPLASAVAFARDKLFAVPAFARRLVTAPSGGMAWEDVPRLDVARHVLHHTCDYASDDPRLYVDLANWCQKPAPEDGPPWDLTLVDCTDCSLIFARVHHAITDGPGMMQALLSCHDDKGAWPRAQAQMRELTAKYASRGASQAAQVPDANASGFGRRLVWAQQAAKACMWTLALWGGLACKFAQAVWSIAVRRADTKTQLKPAHEVTHLRFARAPVAWPLESLKSIAQQLGGGTVNDVLLTIISGALRDCLAAKGEPVKALTIRSMQTVNMPRSSSAMDNNVGLAMADLPIALAEPTARYHKMRATMQAFKASAEPFVAARAMAWVARLPQAVVNFMHRRTTGQCTVHVSNVIGPTEPFVLDGHAAQTMFWFSPRFGDVGVLFPVISYAGVMQVSVQVAQEIGIDPATLAAGLQAHYEILAASAREAAA